MSYLDFGYKDNKGSDREYKFGDPPKSIYGQEKDVFRHAIKRMYSITDDDFKNPEAEKFQFQLREIGLKDVDTMVVSRLMKKKKGRYLYRILKRRNGKQVMKTGEWKSSFLDGAQMKMISNYKVRCLKDQAFTGGNNIIYYVLKGDILKAEKIGDYMIVKNLNHIKETLALKKYI